MRLIVLALFIELPAAAYGAVCPQQSSLKFKDIHARTSASRARTAVAVIPGSALSFLSLVWYVLWPHFALIHVGGY
jgi:hypothetical protein